MGIVAESSAEVAFFGSFNWKLNFNNIVFYVYRQLVVAAFFVTSLALLLGILLLLMMVNIEDNIVNPPQSALSFILSLFSPQDILALRYNGNKANRILYTVFMCRHIRKWWPRIRECLGARDKRNTYNNGRRME